MYEPIKHSLKECEQILLDNLKVLDRKGHYLSAMVKYGFNWYWGVDRLFYLENELKEYFKKPNEVVVFQRHLHLQLKPSLLETNNNKKTTTHSFSRVVIN